MAFERPAPDLQKLITAWEQFEVGEETPGRVLANLKTAGLPEVLRQLADEGWTPRRDAPLSSPPARGPAARQQHPAAGGVVAGRAGSRRRRTRWLITVDDIERALAGSPPGQPLAPAFPDARPSAVLVALADGPRRRRGAADPALAAPAQPPGRDQLPRRAHRPRRDAGRGGAPRGRTRRSASTRRRVTRVRRARPPQHRRQPQLHRADRRPPPGDRPAGARRARRSSGCCWLPLAELVRPDTYRSERWGTHPDRPPAALLRARRRDRVGRHRAHARRPPQRRDRCDAEDRPATSTTGRVQRLQQPPQRLDVAPLGRPRRRSRSAARCGRRARCG